MMGFLFGPFTEGSFMALSARLFTVGAVTALTASTLVVAPVTADTSTAPASSATTPASSAPETRGDAKKKSECAQSPGKRGKSCLQLRLRKKDKRVAAGTKIRLKAKHHKSLRGSTVKVQELKGNGAWQHGTRYRTIRKVKLRSSKTGRWVKFATKINVKDGLKRYRLATKKKRTNRGTRSRNAVPAKRAPAGQYVSGSVDSAVGVIGLAYRFKNKTGAKDLKLGLGVSGGPKGRPAKSKKMTFTDGGAIGAKVLNPPGGAVVGFTLYEENDYESVYHFAAGAGPDPCAKKPQPNIANKEGVLVTFTDKTVFPHYGYAGTMSYSDTTCTFKMYTDLEELGASDDFWRIVLDAAATIALVGFFVVAVFGSDGAALEAAPEVVDLLEDAGSDAEEEFDPDDAWVNGSPPSNIWDAMGDPSGGFRLVITQ